LDALAAAHGETLGCAHRPLEALLARRWRDHYTKKAQDAGYSARSVFKLEEIQRRTRVIPRGGRVVDLGCFPGSWSRYLLEQGVGVLVGVDLKIPEGLDGTYIQGDALLIEPQRILDTLGGPARLVCSDMAPGTTGNRLGDHVKQILLARRAMELARELLAPGGALVVKVFEGEEAPLFLDELRACFRRVRRIKPDATRKRSVEFFAVATGFTGG